MNLIFVYMWACFYDPYSLSLSICLLLSVILSLKHLYIFNTARQGSNSNLVVFWECLSYFGAFVLSEKFENRLVNFQIHKREVVIALSPITVEEEVTWKLNCCFSDELKGSLRIVSLSTWFADEL